MKTNPEALELQNTPFPQPVQRFLAKLSPASKDELTTEMICASYVLQRDFKKALKQDRHRVREAAGTDLTICKICLESQVETVRRCGHAFCKECLSKWRKDHEICPKCMQKLGKARPLYL